MRTVSEHREPGASISAPAQRTANAVVEAEYTCPMHPEVRERHEGSCPKCGMALEPVTPVIDDAAAQVTPMRLAGGVMAGVQRHHVTLGPFPRNARVVHFRFQCTHARCDRRLTCPQGIDCVVQILYRTRSVGDYRPNNAWSNGRGL